MDIGITNKTKEKISKATVKKILNKIGKRLHLKKDTAVSLVFVNTKEMRKLNYTYRQKNEATDALAFPFSSLPSLRGENKAREFVVPAFVRGVWGEIFLCPEEIHRRANERKIKEEEYLKLLLVHALLHLKGMKHDKKSEAELMEAKEKEILSKISNYS